MIILMKIQSIAVFCGSKPGKSPLFTQHATELGTAIASLQLKLVYGGGGVGLMGTVANAVLAGQGEVLGIIPERLMEWETYHKNLTRLITVSDMHVRKKMMYEQCDAAVFLPGGFGTLDELFEMLTWNQLKIHDKKIYILNSGGFYDHLRDHMKRMQEDGFLFHTGRDPRSYSLNSKEPP